MPSSPMKLPILLVAVAALGAVTAAPPAVGAVVGNDDPACPVRAQMALEGRASPLDSAQVTLADGIVKLCYGSPSLRDRTMLGGEEVPFGRLWRMGANEATTLHTTVPLSIGGVQVPAGGVALYAIPDAGHWEVFVTASTTHWGVQITDEVRAQELGSMHVVPRELDAPVESLVFRFEEAGSRSTNLVMEWQTTRIEIPITATGG